MASEDSQDEGGKVVWQLLNSDGKPKVTLRVGNKEREWHESLIGGKYVLNVETDSFLKGPRKITAEVVVKSKDGASIFNYTVELSSDTEPVNAVQWVVSNEEAPAHIDLKVKSHALLGSMNAAAKITRYGFDELTELEEIQTESGFDNVLSNEAISQLLTRQSEFRTKAIQAGMIRPFLYLASMHPITRFQVAKNLGVKLSAKKYHEDPHAEAWAIINVENKKGIQYRTETTTETIFGGVHATWYLSLYRVCNEALGGAPANFTKLNARDSLGLCQTSQQPVLSDFELAVLEKIAEKQRKQIDKKVAKKVDKFMENRTLLDALASVGNSDNLKRFLVELSVLDFVDEDNEMEDDVTADDIIKNLANRTHMGYDPRTKGEKALKKAAKVAATVGKVLFNKLILMALFPPAGVAVLGSNIVNAIFGSSPDVVFPAVVQILLHRLLLGMSGINISMFY